MDVDLFEYEMKKKGYRTVTDRANAMGWSLSAYYRRMSNSIECTKADIETAAGILGWDITHRIFFANEVS